MLVQQPCVQSFWGMFAGLSGVDSDGFKAHKSMLTNFDCTCLFVADRGPLLRTHSIFLEYLKNDATDAGVIVDYRDWQILLGRGFRDLKP